MTAPFKVYKLRPDRRYMGVASDAIDARIMIDEVFEDPRATGAEVWDNLTDRPFFAVHYPYGPSGKRREEGTPPEEHESQAA